MDKKLNTQLVGYIQQTSLFFEHGLQNLMPKFGIVSLKRILPQVGWTVWLNEH